MGAEVLGNDGAATTRRRRGASRGFTCGRGGPWAFATRARGADWPPRVRSLPRDRLSTFAGRKRNNLGTGIDRGLPTARRAPAGVTLAAVSAPGLSSAEDRLGPTKTARHFTPREHRRRIAFASREHRVVHRPATSPTITRAPSVAESRLPTRALANRRRPRDDTPSIMPAAEKASAEPDMYASLGVSKTATNTEIRRAYRNLITKVRGYPPNAPGALPCRWPIVAFSPENARSPRRARLTASAHPHRSIPTRAATPSSGESSAPTTSSPTRRSARTTTPPARLRVRGGGAPRDVRRGRVSRYRQRPRAMEKESSRTPSSRRRNKRCVPSVPSARPKTPVRVRD